MIYKYTNDREPDDGVKKVTPVGFEGHVIIQRVPNSKRWVDDSGLIYDNFGSVLWEWPDGVRGSVNPVEEAKAFLTENVDVQGFLDSIQDAAGYKAGPHVVTAIKEFIK